MAGTRTPVLNIMDMIWIGPDRGPGVDYANAVQVNKIAASKDPVAIDYWASKYVLIPEVKKLPGGRAASMSPDGTEPGTFGYWLRLSMDELNKAGIHATMDETKMTVIESGASGRVSGNVEISFQYERQSGSGSNQFAIWVEDAAGQLVKTIFATEFTVDGGYAFREQSIPLWVERSKLADMSETQVDAVSSATPSAGNLVYTWDLTDDAGALVSAGQYTIYLEASLRFENSALYQGMLNIGGGPVEITPEAQYSGDSAAERGMISDVLMSYSMD
jgi:hypothetical protein